MAKPSSKDNVELHLRIPREVKARLVEHLVSGYFPRMVPQGAISDFIVEAIEAALDMRESK